MDRSDALAIVVTAVDRSYCVLFVLGLKIMGTKTTSSYAASASHRRCIIIQYENNLATQYFPCEAGISRSYQQKFN